MMQPISYAGAVPKDNKEEAPGSKHKEPISEVAQNALSAFSKSLEGPIKLVIKYLSRKDRCAFELSSKFCMGCVDAFWENEIREQGLDMAFAAHKSKNFREKYLFAKVAISIFKEVGVKEPLSLGDLSKVACKYSWVESSSFPNLHRLIQFILYQKQSGAGSNPFSSETEKDRADTFSAALQGSGGDLILQGLLDLRNSRECIVAAASKNSAAADLAATLPGIRPKKAFRIASSEAEKGNFFPLECVLIQHPGYAKKCDKLYPPVLIAKIKNLIFEAKSLCPDTQKHLKAEKLFAQAVSGYGSPIPFYVSILNTFIQYGLSNREEAEAQISTNSLLEQGEILKKLSKKTRERLPGEGFKGKVGEINIRLYYIILAAELKFEFEKWEEANQIYGLLYGFYKKINHVDEESAYKLNEITIRLVYIKMKLGQQEEAKKFYKKIDRKKVDSKSKSYFDFIRVSI